MLLLLVPLLLLRASSAMAAVLAKSDIVSCVVEGSSPAPPPSGSTGLAGNGSIACGKKIVVTLSVANGQTAGTQSIEAEVAAAKDANGTERRLAEPFRITVTKTAVYAVYPLTYLQTFNGRPYEVAVKTDRCRASPSADAPTCGWFLAGDRSSRVYASQGFCCSCGVDDVFDRSILGTSKEAFRTDLDCSLWNQGLFLGGVPSSAHCLRFNRTWYSTFRVGSATLNFQLQINITKPSTGESSKEVLVVGPTAPLALNSDRSVAASLLGDFALYAQLPELASKLVAVPQIEGSTSAEIVADTSQWLLLDSALFALDGLQCDKIGSSFQAFNFEPERCHKFVNSCLRNQLLDLAEADAERISNGEEPLYALSSLGSVTPLQIGKGKYSVALLVTQMLNSVLTLEIKADNVRFLVNRSPGKIVSASASKFESLSGGGRLSAAVQNVGEISADFTVTVQNCSEGIATVVAQMRSIDSGQTANFTFELRTEDASAKNRSCDVLLYDALGALIDNRTVGFSTTATKDNRGSQGGIGNGDQSSNITFSDDLNPCRLCGAVDMACYVRRYCWTQLAASVGAVLGVAAAIVLIILFLMFLSHLGLLLPILKAPFKALSSCLSLLCSLSPSPSSRSRTDTTSSKTNKFVDETGDSRTVSVSFSASEKPKIPKMSQSRKGSSEFRQRRSSPGKLSENFPESKNNEEEAMATDVASTTPRVTLSSPTLSPPPLPILRSELSEEEVWRLAEEERVVYVNLEDARVIAALPSSSSPSCSLAGRLRPRPPWPRRGLRFEVARAHEDDHAFEIEMTAEEACALVSVQPLYEVIN